MKNRKKIKTLLTVAAILSSLLAWHFGIISHEMVHKYLWSLIEAATVIVIGALIHSWINGGKGGEGPQA